jgi:putative ABC transport system ATP-binding protein
MQIELNQIKVDIPKTGQELFKLKKLELPSASKLLIHGASGKGKTTLLHLMAGLLLPKEGTVTLGSHKLESLSDEARAHIRKQHIGFIFQKLNLIEYLTCEENVQLSLLKVQGSKQIVEDALKQVGMFDRAREISVKLSLGEQQRVAVARVLAARPAVILADEPTSSLDAKNADAVMDALFAAAGKTSTLIVVSHDERLRSRFDHTINFDELVRA